MAQVYRFIDENGQTRLMAEIDPAPGGGPAAGSYLPVANTTGVTIDTTTYSDPIAGGGAKLTTLVYASDAGLLAVANLGDAYPRWLFGNDAHNDGVYLGDGTINPWTDGAYILYSNGDLVLSPVGAGNYVKCNTAVFLNQAAPSANHAPKLGQVSPKFTITSGALPTLAPASGTAFQVSTTRDAQLVVPVTYNPGVATTATCKVEISADNLTFSEVVTVTRPVGTVFDGQIDPVDVRVPAAWYVKLTVVNATLGTGTYY